MLEAQSQTAAAQQTFIAVHSLLTIEVGHRHSILKHRVTGSRSGAVKQPLAKQLASTSNRIRGHIDALRALAPLCTPQMQRCVAELPKDHRELDSISKIPVISTTEEDFKRSHQLWLALLEPLCAIGQYEQEVVWIHHELLNYISFCRTRLTLLQQVEEQARRAILFSQTPPLAGDRDAYTSLTSAAEALQSTGGRLRRAAMHQLSITASARRGTQAELRRAEVVLDIAFAEYVAFQSWLRTNDMGVWAEALRTLRGPPRHLVVVDP